MARRCVACSCFTLLLAAPAIRGTRTLDGHRRDEDAASITPASLLQHQDAAGTPLLPHPPFRMWSFAYNATAGGPDCGHTDNRIAHWYCRNATKFRQQLYPKNSYNLLNPAECRNTTKPLAKWLETRGVACMTWESCWNEGPGRNESSTNETVIAHFRDMIVTNADMGITALGLDECGTLLARCQ
jgi:hypothetical protein